MRGRRTAWVHWHAADACAVPLCQGFLMVDLTACAHGKCLGVLLLAISSPDLLPALPALTPPAPCVCLPQHLRHHRDGDGADLCAGLPAQVRTFECKRAWPGWAPAACGQATNGAPLNRTDITRANLVLCTLGHAVQILPPTLFHPPIALSSPHWLHGRLTTTCPAVRAPFSSLRRLVSCPSLLPFLVSPLNVIDLVSIVPWYVEAAVQDSGMQVGKGEKGSRGAGGGGERAVGVGGVVAHSSYGALKDISSPVLLSCSTHVVR